MPLHSDFPANKPHGRRFRLQDEGSPSSGGSTVASRPLGGFILASTVVVLWGIFSALEAGATELRVPDRFTSGEVSVWIFEQNGTKIGEHRFHYAGPAELPGGKGAHRFTAHLRIKIPTGGSQIEQRQQAELWTDERGRLLRHRLRLAMGESVSSVDLTVSGRKALATISRGLGSQEHQVDVPSEVYVQTNNFIGYIDLVLALNPPTPGSPTACQLFSSNALRTFPYRATAETSAGSSEEGDSIPGFTATDSFGEDLTFDSSGRVVRLEMKPQKLVIRKADDPTFEIFDLPAAKTFTWTHDFDAEEVTISHGEVRLAGVITKLPNRRGRLPAIFFISGSGLQDRHGFAGGIDLGTHEILDRLTKEGFLVLRVDDRNSGASVGPTENLGYEGLVADARACVDFLLSRDDVDPKRIVLIGHSEGGVTAPILAAEKPEIAAVVLLAATGRPLTDVMYEQNVAAINKSDLSEEERAQLLADVRSFLDSLVSEDPIDPESLRPEFRAGLRMRPWLRGHARRHPVDTICKVRSSILILQGEKDFQVSPERDAQPLADALQASNHPDFELKTFPDLDHLFKRVAGEESNLAEYFTRRPVDPEFLEVLTGWLEKRLAP